MRFALVLAAVTFAGWRCRNIVALRNYFLALWVHTAVVQVPLLLCGDSSQQYFWTCTILLIPVLLGITAIAYESLYNRFYRLRAMSIPFVVALTLGRMALLGLGHPASATDWVAIVQAGVLDWAGMVLGGSAIYMRRQEVGLILAGLWIAQSCFLWGWVLHLPEILWIKAGWYVPSGLGVVAFIAVGCQVGESADLP